MLNKVNFDFSAAKKFISDSEIDMMKSTTEAARAKLVNKTGAGSDF